MKEETIIKNAILIAQFEGYETEDESRYGNIYYSDDNERTAIDTAYHEELKWLNPVSEKIDKILFDNAGKLGYSDECLKSNDIEVRYQAVVEFIEFYNNQNK